MSGKKENGKDRSARLSELAERGRLERQRLAGAVLDVAGNVRKHRVRWKVAGLAATGVATAGTAAWKLFGKSSPAAKIGKAFLRIRRFL